MSALAQRLEHDRIAWDDDFLTGRVIDDVVAQRSAAAGTDVPVTRVRAGDVTGPELAELLSPSLFADERVVVLAELIRDKEFHSDSGGEMA